MTDSNTVISMMRLFAQWLGRIALILLCIVIAGAVILFAILLIISKGKPKPFLDKDGKVIAKNLRGPALEAKLTELLGMQ